MIAKEISNNVKRKYETKIEKIGIDNFNIILKQLIIQVLDQQWKVAFIVFRQFTMNRLESLCAKRP